MVMMTKIKNVCNRGQIPISISSIKLAPFPTWHLVAVPIAVETPITEHPYRDWGAVYQQRVLLLDALDGHKAHVGTGHGFADGSGIGCIIFAALAREAISSSSFARGTLDVASTP